MIPFTLPKKVYEVIRWLLWLVLPGALALTGTVGAALGLNSEVIATVSTIATAVATFLGVVLGIAKYNNDKS
jgi:hypothetical protein